MRLFKILLILLLSLSLIACGKECTEHRDEDRDCRCDMCDEILPPMPCDKCEDGDGDGLCDACGEECGDRDIVLSEGEIRIVCAKGLGGTANKAIAELIKRLQEFGIEAQRAEDGAKDGAYTDIIIGRVSSLGEKYLVDGHDYGREGYTIKRIDSKIVIAGGSEEALSDAIEEFADAISEGTTGVRVPSSAYTEHKQDDYKIDSVSISGKDVRGYKIVRESDALFISLAAKLRDTLYDKAGYWLEPVTETEDECFFSIKLVSDAGEDGFRVRVENGSLIIECAHTNAFSDALDSFMLTELARGEIDFTDDYLYEKHVSTVKYSDFGAVGDGFKDDFDAIKAAHDYANEGGQRIVPEAGKKYYIGDHGSSSISIMTDTDWTGVTFIIDDTVVLPGSPASTANVFVVKSSYKYTCYNETLENISKMPFSTLHVGDTSVGWAPGFPAALRVMTTHKKNHIRYGYDSSGSNQQEIILVDKDGNIDPSTPVMWDYEIIDYIEVYHADEKPITLRGGHFITWLHTPSSDSGYSYFARGLLVKRANTTVIGLKHTLDKQREEREAVPYGGFLGAQFTTNVLFDSCILEGHRRTVEGSYDTGAFLVNNIEWRNCTQVNYAYNPTTGKFTDSIYDASGRVVATAVTSEDRPELYGRGIWGIMGSNVCKNLVYNGCRLSRFDAHESTYSATIKDSHVSSVNIVGAGTFLFENSVFTSALPNRATENLITIRDDYGSLWHGDIVIRDLHVANNLPNMILVGCIWRNFYYGYPVYMPTCLDIDGITFDNAVTVTLFTKSLEKRSAECGDLTGESLGCARRDSDMNGRCDDCYTPLCKNHTDERDKTGAAAPDGKCDVCNIRICKTEHSDLNGNGRCDACSELMTGGDENIYENLNPITPPEKISVRGKGDNAVFYLSDIPLFLETEIVTEKPTDITREE